MTQQVMILEHDVAITTMEDMYTSKFLNEFPFIYVIFATNHSIVHGQVKKLWLIKKK